MPMKAILRVRQHNTDMETWEILNFTHSKADLEIKSEVRWESRIANI